MNIVKKDIDGLTANLNIQIIKEDYEPRVAGVLNDYRKKARIDGFRPGKVPAGIINKMYGKPVLVDEISKIVNESINKYLTDNNIEIIGDPMPANNDKAIDWEKDSDFDFDFEIGLAPQFSPELSEKDSIPYYQIEVDDKMVESYIDNHTRRYGRFTEQDAAGEESLIYGQLAELDADGKLIDEGIRAENSNIFLNIMKDEDEKKKFIGAKIGDIVTFDVKKAYPNEYELKNILKVEPAAFANISGLFQMLITSISVFEKADVNQELFDKVFGEGTVKSEEEFKAKLTDDIRATLEKESNYRFLVDARKALLEKYNLTLPVEFLKKWLKSQNETVTEEQFDKEFPTFVEDLKWQLVKNKLVKSEEVKVNDEDMIAEAKDFARQQFAQYGLSNVPDEHLESYATDMLKREKEAHSILERVIDQKIGNLINEKTKPEVKFVSSEEFNKLYETA
jgi:trigger factor